MYLKYFISSYRIVRCMPDDRMVRFQKEIIIEYTDTNKPEYTDADKYK